MSLVGNCNLFPLKAGHSRAVNAIPLPVDVLVYVISGENIRNLSRFYRYVSKIWLKA